LNRNVQHQTKAQANVCREPGDTLEKGKKLGNEFTVSRVVGITMLEEIPALPKRLATLRK